MSLFEEALADSKKLKEVAEQNAKNKIIEYISPKIKDMIEKQLLGESFFEDDEKDILEASYKETEGDQEDDYSSNKDDDEDEEFVLSTESAKMLADLLKEDNFSENVELQMYRLFNKLQTEIAKENKSIENLNEIKNELYSLVGQLNENKDKLEEADFNKFDTNLSYLADSTNKIIKHQIFKTFDEHQTNLNKVVASKKLKKESKKRKATKILENAKTLCLFINENKLIKEKKDFNSLTRKLNQISKEFKKTL